MADCSDGGARFWLFVLAIIVVSNLGLCENKIGDIEDRLTAVECAASHADSVAAAVACIDSMIAARLIARVDRSDTTWVGFRETIRLASENYMRRRLLKLWLENPDSARKWVVTYDDYLREMGNGDAPHREAMRRLTDDGGNRATPTYEDSVRAWMYWYSGVTP